MAHKTGALQKGWQSTSARRGTWVLMFASFLILICLGSYLRIQEEQLREDTLVQTARILASSTLSAGGETEEILLKVSDLLNVDSVLGVKLLQGTDVPLNVGEISTDLPISENPQTIQSGWDETGAKKDVALRLENGLPFDWIILRLDAPRIVAAPIWGTSINWIAAPLISLLLGMLNLWLWGRMLLRPIAAIQHHLQDNSGKLSSAPLPQDLTKGNSDSALLAQQIEAMRVEISEAKIRADAQARFLYETPYPLLRCSVNRKVLYANSAARAQKALFGDDSKEFVAPALSELVRKAFYESKQVFGDVRCKDQIITFRAVPVLDAGYVNLYGEVKRHMDDDI